MGADIRLGSDGDIDLTNGRLELVDSLAQRLRIRLRFVRGEWFLEPLFGMPYFDRILVKSPNIGHVRKAISDMIVATDGVRSLTSLILDFDRPARKLTATFRVNAENFEQELSIP